MVKITNSVVGATSTIEINNGINYYQKRFEPEKVILT